MRLRKLLCIFLTAMLMVASFSFAVSADEEGKTYTMPDGLTFTLPPEYEEALWIGMDDDDPLLNQEGMTISDVQKTYDYWGIEFQAPHSSLTGMDNPFFIIMELEAEAPSDTSAKSFIEEPWRTFDPMDNIDSNEIYGSGLADTGDLPVFKLSYQVTGDYVMRGYQYTILTSSGRIHQFLIFLVDTTATDGTDLFSEDDLDFLDYTAEYIEGTIKYSGETIPFEADPYTLSATPASPGGSSGSTGSTSFFKSFTGFEFPLWLLAALLIAILIAGAKVSKRHEWQEKPLGLDTSKAIQGFAAVAIILHHLSQDLLDRAGPFEFLSECGVIFVGIFFFFSGYGLYTSLKTKENYLKGFLKKRLITILIPFYSCIAVFTVASCICGAKYKPLELLSILSGWSLINTHMWYIVEIAILYLAFFIIYRLIKNRTIATVVMGIFVLLMMAGSLYLCHGEDFSCSYWFMGEWWFNSTFLFIIGIIVSKHSELLTKIARKAYIVLVPVFGVLTVLFYKQTIYALHTYSYWSEIPGVDPAYKDKLRCLVFQLPFIICFVTFVILIMLKVRFGNPVLKFLRAISLELYLIHNLFLTGLKDGTIFRVTSPSMYIILTILMAIGAATIISGTDKYIISLITGKLKGQEDLNTSRNHSIDVMRIIMAFLVVTIHWPFDGKAGNVFFTFGKTAVPFFLVICGYMLYRDDSKEMMKRLLKQTKRMLIFFVGANLFYGVVTAIGDLISMGRIDMKPYFTSKKILDFVLYNFSPFSEHLWFLGSLLYALIILLILNKLKVVKYAVFAGPLLIAAYVILSHLNVGEPYQLRNAILVGLSYPLTGMLIRRFEKNILSIKFISVILIVLSILASAAAIFELNTYKRGVEVPFVGCEVLTIVLVLLCLKFPEFGMGTYAEKLGRRSSLGIYIMHIFTMMIFLITNNSSFFGRYGAVAIFAVTAVGVELYECIKEAVIKTR
ncbi:MAG: acyltransferase [Clostridiales bacterium]|nr:acyltransferase [Clostridiales bacterium]